VELDSHVKANQCQTSEEMLAFLAEHGITSSGGLRSTIVEAVLNDAQDATFYGRISNDGQVVRFNPNIPYINRDNNYFETYQNLIPYGSENP
jgi:hypothetical protein